MSAAENDAARAHPSSPRGSAGIVLLLLFGAAAVGGWILWTVKSRDRSVPVSVEEFLSLKRRGLVREIWLERYDLVAEMGPGFIRDGKPCTHVRSALPHSFVDDATGFRVLVEGMDPNKVHHSAGR